MPTPDQTPRLLITAGPTYEPIDAVRFIGNRSSGRLGIALAQAAAARSWPTTLLLGPNTRTPPEHVPVRRFDTTADLQALLREKAPASDVIVMAAAVADFRVAREGLEGRGSTPPSDQKLRRTGSLTLQLEPTPDLLAELAAARHPGQLIVGFALEPRSRLLESARDKLRRKGLDLIVANPLETMDADTIEATVLSARGSEQRTDGPITKDRFAPWLLDIIQQHLATKTAQGGD